MKRDVLIVGGGVSGLTVAYDLTRRGIDCLVVEKEERLGGLIFTAEQEGFLMDFGPDAFLVQKPHAKALCDELGLSSELIPTNPKERKVYVLYRGALRAMPDGMRLTAPTKVLPLLRSDLFSPSGKLRLLVEPFIPARRADATSDESVASFVRRRFGSEALERVGEPLLAGIHCGDPDKLSMTRLFPRFVELEATHGSVTRGLLRTKRDEGPMFLALAKGMARLPSRLREALPVDAVCLGCPAVEVSARPGAGGFDVKLGSGETVHCRALVSAVPLPAAASLLAPVAPTVAHELSRVPMVSTAVVFLGFRRASVDHPLDGYGFVVPRGEANRLLAATFVTTKFPGRARDGDALFRIFLGGTKDPDAYRLTDAEMMDLAAAELARALGVDRLGDPVLTRVARWERRTPQVEVGHGAIVHAVENGLRSVPGLHVLANGLGGVGIPDTVQNARVCAEVLESELGK